jgi:hypothetical protein
MMNFESPDFNELKQRNIDVARLGGIGVEQNIADGITYAHKANEAYSAANTEMFEAMTEAAGILIGKKSLGGLEMAARIVRWQQGTTPMERDPSLARAMRTMLLSKFLMVIDNPPFDMTADELMLETARGMHRMKAEQGMGLSVLAPMELWNREDVLEEAVITGLHPWVAWSARGTSDDIDESTPLYGEFIMTDMYIRKQGRR